MTVTTCVKESPTYNIAKHPSLVIQEEKKAYMKHDQLFKELIHNFFQEFLEAFFPSVHRHIDFKSIKSMSEEMFTDLLDGESRRADIVVEVKLKGEDTLIIIHVEPQSYVQPGFHERMYHYFSLLYNKYRKPILPIAVFSYDEKRTEQNQFIIEFPFFKVLSFNFLMLELNKMNWREYLKSNNPVAAALLSKMGYSDQEKIQVKKEFLRMIVKMELNPARARFINDFFEKYLILNEREEEELMQEINQLDNADEIMKLPNSWEKKGIEKVAIEMLKEGLSTELIIKVTLLNKDEVERLRNKLVE